MGKLIGHSRTEIDLGARILEYYAQHGPAQLADETLDCEGGTAVLVNAPLGVVLGVQPWNLPSTRWSGSRPRTWCSATRSCSSTPAAVRSRRSPSRSVPRRRRPGRRVHEPLHRDRRHRRRDREPTCPGGLADRKRGCRCARRRAGRAQPEEERARARRQRPVHRARRRAPGAHGRRGGQGPPREHGPELRGVQALHRAPRALRRVRAGMRDRFAALTPGDPADPATTLAPLSSERAAEQP